MTKTMGVREPLTGAARGTRRRPGHPSRTFGRYRHDGQTPIEDRETRTEWPHDSFALTRYGLGARGVDMIEMTTADLGTNSPAVTTTGFPIYDAHGNDVATLTRSGSGGYSVGDRRSYDAWGVVRAQQSGGDPQLRYCASLGHKADDESGLVYMRARYYDPSCGRFVSEDPAQAGKDWFWYCSNDPVNKVDETGRSDVYKNINKWLGPAISLATIVAAAAFSPLARFKAIADLGFLAVWFGFDMKDAMPGDHDMRVFGGILMISMVELVAVAMNWERYGAELTKSSSPASQVVAICLEEAAFLSLFMTLEDISGD